MRRKWIEGIIIGICIAFAAWQLQIIFGQSSVVVQLLALLVSSAAICLIQLLISIWHSRDTG